MKQFPWKLLSFLAFALCLGGILLAPLSLDKMAHAASRSPAMPATAAGCSFAMTTQIPPGNLLFPGDAWVGLTACNTPVVLVYQQDSNLVLYIGASPHWASGTIDCAGDAAFQPDGNLVIHNCNGAPIWATGTFNKGASRLDVQSNGNVVIYNGSTQLWATNTCCVSAISPLPVAHSQAGPLTPLLAQPGTSPAASRSPSAPATAASCVTSQTTQVGTHAELLPGDAWVGQTSCNGPVVLVYQADGNLVLYIGASPHWASHTNGMCAGDAFFQDDGNLVVYDCTGAPRWGSGSNNKGAIELDVQSSGNVAILDHLGHTLWQTNTCCF